MPSGVGKLSEKIIYKNQYLEMGICMGTNDMFLCKLNINIFPNLKINLSAADSQDLTNEGNFKRLSIS